MDHAHLIHLLLIPTMMLIHRLRGGLIPLPFKLTYFIWPFVGLAFWLVGGPWQGAIAWAVGYLIWTVFGWMTIIDDALGEAPAGQVTSHTWDVEAIEVADFGNAIWGCFLRAAVYILPLLAALVDLHENPLGLLLIVLTFYPSYLIGSILFPTNPAIFAETTVGAFWGMAMVIALL